MSYRYFQPRTRCHSAFQHYTAFHWGGGDTINIGSNNTTIFNCGGHTGGFWGGFGLGLGNAFGSIFGGLFGGGMGFGGMGGFGGFGMSGFGFPSFGGGWGSGYGNFGGGSGNLGGLGGSSNRTSSTTSTCNCKCGKDKTDKAGENGNANDDNDIANTVDKDQAKLKECIDELKAFQKAVEEGNELDSAKVSELRETLTELKDKPLDELNEAANKDHYGRLLDSLNEIAPQKDGNNKVVARGETTGKRGNGNGDGEETAPGSYLARLPIGEKTEEEIYKMKNIPFITKLSQADAQVLKKNGCILKSISNDKYGLSLPNPMTKDSLEALKKIADKYNVPIAAANNTGSDVKDHWIAGKLDEIKEENGKLSFSIDCKNVGTQGGKFEIKQADGTKWHVKCTRGEGLQKENTGYTYNDDENVLSANNEFVGSLFADSTFSSSLYV